MNDNLWMILWLIPCFIFLIIFIALSFKCDDPTIVGEADGYQFRKCQCLHKGHTYRCHATNNAWEGLQAFFKVGEYKNMKSIYYFKAETMGLK